MKLRQVCLAPGLVSPGMTLAIAVSGRDGHSLLEAGASLDTDMLERLIRRGIESLWVQIPDERDAETIALEIQTMEKRVDQIFRGAGSPARDELHQVVREYRREVLK